MTSIGVEGVDVRAPEPGTDPASRAAVAVRDDARPTEAQAHDHPDAVAGRAALDQRLIHLTDPERAAYWEAVRLCYGSFSLHPAAEAPAA